MVGPGFDILKELEDKIVIVEGKKDKDRLKSFGIKNVFAINGKPLYVVAKMVSEMNRDIVILTDFDKEGRLINSKLTHLFNKYKKQPNKRLRNMFMSLGKNRIEDLKEVDVHVKIGSNFNKVYNKGKYKCKRCYRKTRRYRGNFWSD
ncbi:MAG: hypothetical protein DRP03_00025 [Candidatus Aenigmatarchaeota archaeon]|nr:MAG: hypothetical protein DRP03_00025 [Candidatus Aenigmarchaeota archaeon]